MKYKIVDKKRFIIFTLSTLLLFVCAVLAVIFFILKMQKNNNANTAKIGGQPILKDIKESALGENAPGTSEDVTKEKGNVVEYKNNVFNYSLSFSEKWYMNNDYSNVPPVLSEDENLLKIAVGGQTFWSNYEDINKYTSQNKPDDFRLLGLNVYQDKSESIVDFSKKIGIPDFATKEDFQGIDMVGVQYVMPGFVEKNPSVTIIFQRGDYFFVFRPAFLNGDSESSDIMEEIVRSFSAH